MFGTPSPLRANRPEPVTRQKIRPGTVPRIFPYARRYRWMLAVLLCVTALDALIAVANPLLLRVVIDDGILPRRMAVVVALSLGIVGLSLLDALAIGLQSWSSARIGEGLVYDLRTEVFRHVRQQPVAFFTRAQTGSLVSRLNTDVIGAQQAVTSLLAQTVSGVLTLILVLGAMFYLSWLITVIGLVLLPVCVLPVQLIGRRLQRLTREGMQLDADIGSMMNERFNVAGAMLTKLYGRPDEEDRLFAARAARVRDVAIVGTVYGRAFLIVVTVLAGLTTALVYGVGGGLVITSGLQIGSLVALIALLARLYAPMNQLSSVQMNAMTALVSFDRIFEILDLRPLVAQRADAYPLPVGGAGAPGIEFDQVSFRYPAASEVSLASLESIARPTAEREQRAWILRDVSFRAPGGTLTALVGPSGAGKTTLTHLLTRLYDPTAGNVRIDGHDVRDLTLESLRGTVGVVAQDPHLFHDTIRANLLYACPSATGDDLIEVCRAARIWDLISALPDGFDTVVGDRGYRLSGGEKQRVALARLLLKAPRVVLLDEATAHLDSESERAIQQALRTALAGRTSLVIAHRLSTVREASQILVLNGGQLTERGTHEELLLAGGLYTDLYRAQFARQTADGDSQGTSKVL
jgi:ATP-binding cassette subfamily B protein